MVGRAPIVVIVIVVVFVRFVDIAGIVVNRLLEL
jgi:hypothetical protein